MKVKERPSKQQKSKYKRRARIVTALFCILALALISTAIVLQRMNMNSWGDSSDGQDGGSKNPLLSLLDPGITWQMGYIATQDLSVEYVDAEGTVLGTVNRGTQVQFTNTEDGRIEIVVNGTRGYLPKGVSIVSDPADVLPNHRLYVRTAVNLRDENGRLLSAFATKGTSVEVIGYDYFEDDGNVHMYLVKFGDNKGYIMPHYLVDNKAGSLESYDGDGNFETHADRDDDYGGGGGGNLDYFPREKASFEDNVMPEECRTLYINGKSINRVDEYLEIAKQCDINAFIVDIVDGNVISYTGDVMREISPSTTWAAHFTPEQFQEAIQKIKDAGYYVIGRITTFNDSYLVRDHPEWAIADTNGQPLMLHGAYWPSAYCREAWQYKVDVAIEAVELMGFDEINFDYVRFPDRVGEYERDGTIDFRNTYNETKAQAIQRFLMYATDILHEYGVYVSADVYGECAYNYITSYGQYWPAISNVVDAICGMPYPDHFESTETWRPWEHPYETLLDWGERAMLRQGETASPAQVRTWVQSYDAMRAPFNTYGPDEVAAEILGLRDAGCTGGYLTWNGASPIGKYTSLIPAFTESYYVDFVPKELRD